MILKHFDWCVFNSFASLLADYINVSKHLKWLKYPNFVNISYIYLI
jgi:hypothetical protein